MRDTSSHRSDDGAPTPNLCVTCWGTRGSIPSPGPTTARFGGNTSCVEVRWAGGGHCIFDAGTGIRALGQKLASAGPARTELFLTHFHWDHIQGLPFFEPLYDAAASLRIHGAPQRGVGVRELVARQMNDTNFPLPFESIRANVEYVDVNADAWTADGLEVDGIRVFHPAETYGYRIRAGGSSMAFVPDNELASASRAGYRDLLRFVGDVDLLLHDAMYTDEEYSARQGWGHSSFRQAIRFAEEAGVRRLCLFHHAPERSDGELCRIVDYWCNELAARGSALELLVATEGEELQL